MSKILVILTKKYPYGLGEAFIDAERSEWKRFDKVYICPIMVNSKEEIREGFKCANNETLIQTYEFKHRKDDFIKGLKGYYSLRHYLHEILLLEKQGKLSKENVRAAIGMAIYTNLRIARIKDVLIAAVGDSIIDGSVLLYSYWMYEPALVGVGLKELFSKVRLISRAHGYDVYEERHNGAYIPFRKLVFDALDHVYTISENGKNYLNEKYHYLYQHKISVSRLGIIKLFEEKYVNKSNSIVIASCAYMKPIKRIHLIIQALKKVNEDVVWYHFGDGVVRQELERNTKELPDNVKAIFMGLVPNEEIQRFYATHYIDAFINVSETEGIPVSIMEAQAYGIPAVATDVGGTSEIVFDKKNGVLLNVDFSDEDLISAINIVINAGQEYRICSKQTWMTLENAQQNYNAMFVKELELINKQYN